MAALPRSRPGKKLAGVQPKNATAKTNRSALATRLARLLEAECGPANWPKSAEEGAVVTTWLAEQVATHNPAEKGPLIALLSRPDIAHTHLIVLAVDQPFLTDTLKLALARAGARTETLAHPVVQIGREGGTATIRPMHGGSRGTREAFIYAQIRPQEEENAKVLLQTVTQSIQAAVNAVSDFPTMCDTMEKQLAAAAQRNGRTDRESASFLRWLLSGNFVFLGYRHYDYAKKGADITVQATPASGLGMLRNVQSRVKNATTLAELEDGLSFYVKEKGWLILSKTPQKSIIHRGVAMDYVAILERDEKGNVVGEHRWLGLYTSSAHTAHVREIPLAREKMAAVLGAAPWSRHGYNYRALVNILETYPRDELLLTSEETLLKFATGMVMAQEKEEPRLLVRKSEREQTVSCFVILPFSRMSTHIRQQAQVLLTDAFKGHESDFRSEVNGDSDTARIFYRIRTRLWPQNVNEIELEKQIRNLILGWEEAFRNALVERHGGPLGEDLWERHVTMGDTAYRSLTPAAVAVEDADMLATCMPGRHDWRVRVMASEGNEPGLHLRIYREGTRWSLSTLVPLLADFGLSVDTEETHCLQADGVRVWLHILRAPMSAAPTAQQITLLQEALTAALAGALEQDDLNRLVLIGGQDVPALGWLRALISYAQQVNSLFNPAMVRGVLIQYPALAGALVALARARLQPGLKKAARSRMEAELNAMLELEISNIPVATSEQVMNTLWQVTLATLRTNAWQMSSEDAALALKLDPTKIDALPQPKPWREIFVYHPFVEGVHLRGGPIARGGLRHSDRAQDYRTEVLGLVTAQIKKNTIIVPTGAKGGFFIKQALPADRASAQAIVRAGYRMYIRALLSITDNRTLEGTVPPRQVFSHDAPDPYLVVAADKGTATFSDLANETAIHADFWDDAGNGFWLQDAFASGGSNGYDHKEMGITARGAWVSVMHHAAQLGILPSKERNLSMIGIGDMAGDVFGNGLLLSPHTHLVAAFNHAHIFVDPTPDAASAFAERKRLFKAKGGWDAYDTSKISTGGGVYPRSLKKIPLSQAARKRLGLGAGDLTPEQVIKGILMAEADALWNGGIGTYIKSSAEPQTAAADKSNDALRVDAKQVHVKIIGEGGNLGITTAGRVELAQRGIRLNTDALDNSAGVDTSDHEVNLKILLDAAVLAGALPESQRNPLLKEATEQIAAAVLENNRLQNWAVSLAEQAPASAHTALGIWQQKLADDGYLHPKRDGLPTLATLHERKDCKYTRPELCVLLAATKGALRAEIAGADWLMDQPVTAWVEASFPQCVREKLGAKKLSQLVAAHPLRNKLGEMVVANTLVNRLGMTIASHLQGDSETPLSEVLKALTLSVEIAHANELWAALDVVSEKNVLSPTSYRAALVRTRQALSQLGGWLLAQQLPMDVKTTMDTYHLPKGGIVGMCGTLPPATAAMLQTREGNWRKEGVGAEDAVSLAHLGLLVIWPEVVTLSAQLGHKPEKVFPYLVAVSETLHLPQLTQHVRRLEEGDNWTRQAVAMLVQELLTRQRLIATTMMQQKVPVEDVPSALPNQVTGWRRYQSLVKQLGKQEKMSIEQLTVLVARLRPAL